MKKFSDIILESRRFKIENAVFEMAFSRKDYKAKIDAELPQIFTNWCLVRYRTITNSERYKKHWIGKFRGHMYNAVKISLKGGDLESTRKKLMEEIIEAEDYETFFSMSLTIMEKFKEENINVNSDDFKQTVIDCINAIPKIIGLIISRNVDDINEYAETI